jgi:hypothetical protein
MFLCITIGILVCMATACRATKDTLAHHYSSSIFSGKGFNPLFWDNNISWENKWKNGDKKQGEKFLFSSTVFVWTTDAWHMLSAIELMSMHLAIAMTLSLVTGINILLLLVGIKVLYAIVFNYLYDKALKKK